MKKVLLIVGILLLGVGFLAFLLYLGARGINQRDVTEAEKGLLLSLDKYNPEYAAYFRLDTCSHFQAKTNFDGSLELEYVYDFEKDPESPVLYYSSEAEVNRSLSDARESYRLTISAYKTGIKLVAGRKMHKRENLFTLGEENYFAEIEDEGEPIGALLVFRQGNIVHSLLAVGMTFESREELEGLFAGVVEVSKNWE